MTIRRFPRSRQSALPYPATLDLNFLAGDTLDPRITFTRADATTCATRFNASGVLETVAANVGRIDYNPSTLNKRGFLVEESRANSIRNNTMQGAVAGTPGTLPTNWQQTAGAGGITVSVIGTGTENGITYIDLRWSGTPTSTNFPTAFFDTTTGIAALQNQTWTNSVYIKLVGGSLTNVAGIAVGMWETGAAGGFLASGVGATVTPTNANLATQRYTFTRTLTNASTAFVRPLVTFTVTNGLAIDITLRIGLPQLEQGAFVTSVIPTTSAALTRAVDAASVPILVPWFNAAAGTLYAEWVTAVNDATNNRGIAALDDGSNNNRVAMFIPNSFTPLAVAARVVSGGSATNPANAGSIALSSTAKSALTYGVGTNEAALCVNGASPTTASPAAAPVGVNTLRIGAIFGVNPINGWLRHLRYYPVRLSNTDLQAITA